jgi:RHS repeat-associated protein
MEPAAQKYGGTDPSPKRGLTPEITPPKGGGSINGMGEKFAANPVAGTGSMSVPIATSPGRAGFGPQLSLSYNSGSANSPFGFGWDLSLPAIARKTDKGLPRYRDAEASDTFILSGADDLVPALRHVGDDWARDVLPARTVHGRTYIVHRYRPRVEGLFARIERWVDADDATGTCWRTISKDNITTWYGRTAQSRIADPLDATRIFTWLICESHDDKGNAVFYEYKPEDSAGVDLTQSQERNRSTLTRSAQRYIKRIRYGHLTPYFPDLNAAESTPAPADACFEVVFDYGEHDLQAPLPRDEAHPWTCRADPWSNHRACFEVRTYRLCRRVLMFHHFPQEAGVGADCLVQSTDLVHATPQPADAVHPFYSFLLSARRTGYVRNGVDGYRSSSLPPLEFEYSQAAIDETVRNVDPHSARNLPEGLDAPGYRWVDLDGEGVPGILTEQGGSWFYKSNLSPAQPDKLPRFGPMQRVASQPSTMSLNDDGVHLMDLSNDGELDVVEFGGPSPGYFERAADPGWQRFRRFRAMPVLDWNNPNLRFIDLTGDGFPDLLVSEDDAFYWHRSLATEGFQPAQRMPQARDSEHGPQLVFSDGSDSIFLADMCGDGLTDLVRIRNGEVCYWPNLGYGRFGAKITMAAAPRFDSADQFDGKRLRLADIDGSGTTDILYFANNAVHIYFNQSGNAWGGRRSLDHFPAVESVSSAMVLDLLGSGTACLLWSTPLAAAATRPLRYIDLMGGQKPHLLVRTRNNLGAETAVAYAPSTRFYVADKLAGRPWLTRLPLPVHVIERVATYDYISRNRFVTRYAYHHGYYDGVEREFRGFGCVDQWDTEEITTVAEGSVFGAADNQDPAYSAPPVHIKTWYHTGAWFKEPVVSRQFAAEYYDEGDHSDAIAGLDATARQAMLLDDTTLPDTVLLADGSRVACNFSPEEMREACRALRGSILRQEIYGLDGTDAADRPYSTSERNYTIQVLQPRAGNANTVCFAHARESIEFQYERTLYKVLGDEVVDAHAAPPDALDAADPRVSHTLTFATDPYGNVLQSAAIAYGRRYRDAALATEDQQRQRARLCTCAQTSYTNAILAEDAYRTPLAARSSQYELLQLPAPGATPATPAVTPLLRYAEVAAAIQSAADGTHDIPFEQTDPTGLLPGQVYRRRLADSRIVYRPDDMGASTADAQALLPLGTMEALALPGIQYQLVFTPGLLSQVYQRAGTALLPTPADVLGSVAADGGGYVDLDGDGHWWQPSIRVFHAPAAATPASEQAEARQHFYLPRRTVDAFGNGPAVNYDAYGLLPLRTIDAVGNVVQADNDYRVLAAVSITDPNGNRSAAAFDALGMLAGTAVMGKATENLGDTLAGFAPDLAPADVAAFYDADDLHVPAVTLLGAASMRTVYDPLRFYESRLAAPGDPTQWVPSFAATISRETHASELAQDEVSRTQIKFGYFDGFGRTVQQKIQAEAGWIGSGWTIFNNKGKPVRQFEPFFSPSTTKGHRFEFGIQLGVSPILLYDAPGRIVATLRPDHSYEKLVFDPWRQAAWDANDTVLIDNPAADADVGRYFALLPPGDFVPTWYARRITGGLGAQEQDAATKAAAHANTPYVSHLDAMGRTFLAIADNGAGGKHASRLELDVQGYQRSVIDALGRKVMVTDYTLPGAVIHTASMESGERWNLADAAGKAIRAWDARGHQFRIAYDPLRRPTSSFVQGTDPVQSDPRTATERLFHQVVYGEGQPDAAALNLRTRTYTVSDTAGVVTNMGTDPASGQPEGYDFKGNPIRVRRQFVADHRMLPDWSAPPALGAGFAGLSRYDALNRPTSATTPDRSITHMGYNAAGLLETVSIELAGSAATPMPFIRNIDYDAKGQRTRIEFGNGVITSYTYDPSTFRMASLLTRRDPAAFPGDCPTPQAADWPGCQVQNLAYTYDPVGNITSIRDAAQQTIFFRNQRVEPGNDYTYDALYRLIQATGREQLGLAGNGGPLPPAAGSYNDVPRVGLLSPSDGNAMGTYVEQYEYDAAGNFLTFVHKGSQPSSPGWKRTYAYNEASLLEPGQVSNRMSATLLSGSQALNETYAYDPHGNMTAMPQLQAIEWNFQDQPCMSQRQAVNADDADGARHQGERTYYVYDGTGQRARKVTESAAGAKRKERYYLDGFETYIEYDNGGAITLQRDTLHVTDDRQRIAMVETRAQGNDGSPARSIRYQFGNQLGSAVLELDETAQVVTYEEFCPYGNTSYQAGRSAVEVSLKRYRYTRMERDEETGLGYHQARYYASWLGRWTSCDPSGLRDGLNLYEYARCSPTGLTDPHGTDSRPPTEEEAEKIMARQRELREVYTGDLPKYNREAEPPITPTQRKYMNERIEILRKLASHWNQNGREHDASLMFHIIGDLMFEIKISEMQWNQLSDANKGYWGMKLDHPDWAVKPNVLNTVTGAIVTESLSMDVNVFMNIAVGFITTSVIPPTPKSTPAATMPRARLDNSSVRINGQGFGIADAEGVMAHQSMNRFFPRWIRGGTQLILSRGPVNQNGIWAAMKRFGRIGRQKIVLAGVHGDEAGRVGRQTLEEIASEGVDMWKADQEAFGRTRGIRLLQADNLSDFELDALLTSGADVYAGWCHSAVCSQLVRAFNRVNGAQ